MFERARPCFHFQTQDRHLRLLLEDLDGHVFGDSANRSDHSRFKPCPLHEDTQIKVDDAAVLKVNLLKELKKTTQKCPTTRQSLM